MTSGRAAVKIWQFAAASLLAGLAGCVAVPVQQYAPPMLVAYPGQGKVEAAFKEDDALCRTASGQAPAPGTELSPGQIYLRCMASRGDVIQPIQGSQPVAYAQPLSYAYYPSYPVYAAYDGYYPWLYGGYLGGGFGFGGGYYRGGYGAFRDGSFHGGGFDGGYHGGGFGEGRGFGGGGGFGGGRR